MNKHTRTYMIHTDLYALWVLRLVFWMSGPGFRMFDLYVGCLDLYFGCLDLHFGCLDLYFRFAFLYNHIITIS